MKTSCKKIYTAIIIILLILNGFLIYKVYSARFFKSVDVVQVSELNASDSSDTTSSEPRKINPIASTSKTLWFGDVFWGRYVDDWSKTSPLKTAYPFSGLNTFEREKYDAWIADLECPITQKYIDSATQDDTLSFSCLPEYTPEASKWFTAFTLANNHTDNMGVEGFNFTKKILEENKIQYFGTYDNSQKDDTCEIISIDTNLIYPENTPENLKVLPFKQKLPIAVCGFHSVFKLPTEGEMAVVANYAKYFPTFVMPHQGKEYTYVADQLQEEYSRKVIDLGADAVIGDHVHSVQNTEAYNGKLIVYSLGNFIFDQQFSQQVTRAIGLDMTINLNYDKNLEKYLEIGKNCEMFKDDCLKIAQEQNLKKPELSLKYDIVASDNSGKLAKKASDEVLEDLKIKTNWIKTLEGLE